MERSDIFRDLLSQWLGTSTEEEISELQSKLEAVESSNLAAVGYDERQQVLEVAFLDGSVYQYYRVPADVYRELMEAPSHGSYFYWNIREAYRYYRIIG